MKISIAEEDGRILYVCEKLEDVILYLIKLMETNGINLKYRIEF